jgi:myo-inositol-1(or 4)-monophosphatase
LAIAASDREPLLLAERAACAAGRFLAAGPRRNATLAAEILAAGSPFSIVAEERMADASAPPADGLRWIVDPLDGTMNYLQGIPFCCVSVALWNGDDPVAAAVYDFDRDEMFTAIAGAGAWLNGSAIRVRSAPPDRAVLCTGFPAGTDFAPDAVSRFVAQVSAFRKIRLLGSAARAAWTPISNVTSESGTSRQD